MATTRILIPLALVSIIALAGCTSYQPPAGNGSINDNTPVAGECGGIAGIQCPQGFECRYPEDAQPDSFGTCVFGGEKVVVPDKGSAVAGVESNATHPDDGSPAALAESYTVSADDYGFYPDSLGVEQGADLSITFLVDSTSTYYGGLEMRGGGLSSGVIGPGRNATVTWRGVNQSFSIVSYWPASSVRKATLSVAVLPPGSRSLSGAEWEIVRN